MWKKLHAVDLKVCPPPENGPKGKFLSFVKVQTVNVR